MNTVPHEELAVHVAVVYHAMQFLRNYYNANKDFYLVDDNLVRSMVEDHNLTMQLTSGITYAEIEVRNADLEESNANRPRRRGAGDNRTESTRTPCWP